MARMIPDAGPRPFDPKSREGYVYHALEKLPDSFVVVHSMKFAQVKAGSINEREADFVVFHRDLGILCIEAKNGAAYYDGSTWRYASGVAMRHGGPYNQAMNSVHALEDYMRDKGMHDVLSRCKRLHAVWFIGLSRDEFEGVDLPPEASVKCTLFSDDLEDAEPAIRRVFSYKVAKTHTKLTAKEADGIVGRVLCPRFGIVPTNATNASLMRAQFAMLLDSQKHILDFMEYQRSAVIAGAAGTGKTLIALEKARRLAERGGRVLFLCYNKLLKDHLRQQCKGIEGIDVNTIGGLAVKYCDSLDYTQLAEVLLDMHDHGGFPYDHVVVDEGQDFGQENLEGEAFVLDVLKDLTGLSDDGSFYVFYDKNQLVQGTRPPSIIDEADCKMTLYINCRNTENIAKSASRSLGETGKMAARTIGAKGAPNTICFSTDLDRQVRFVDESIDALRKIGAKSIAILTCKTYESKLIASGCKKVKKDVRYWGNESVPIYTCRTFKGLEADGIILVDVDRKVWLPEGKYAAGPGLLYYTGASRARFGLSVLCDMDEGDVRAVLSELGITSGRVPPKQRLANELSGFVAP